MRIAFAAVIALVACSSGRVSDRNQRHPGGPDPSVAVDREYGSYRREITAAAQEARELFDQGLRLEYGFNHERALRSYSAALEADPKCAMCWWGIALASGPNINAPMSDSAGRVALRAIGEANRLSSAVTPLERELIEALESRFDSSSSTTRAAL